MGITSGKNIQRCSSSRERDVGSSNEGQVAALPALGHLGQSLKGSEGREVLLHVFISTSSISHTLIDYGDIRYVVQYGVQTPIQLSYKARHFLLYLYQPSAAAMGLASSP